MYAVVETGGQQFKVEAGQKIKVEKLTGEVGDEVTLDKVLLVKSDDSTQVGTPYLENAKVTGKILAQDRHPKVVVFKFKRRKGFKRKRGHRQHFTQIQIDSIQV